MSVLNICYSGMVAITLVISIFVIIISIIGTFSDAAGATYFTRTLQSCTTPSGALSGSSKYFVNATICYTNAVNSSSPTFADCYCADDIGNCRFIDGQSDCAQIFSYYRKILAAGAWFDLLALVAMVSLTIVSCCIVCCPNNCGSADQRTTIVYATDHTGDRTVYFDSHVIPAARAEYTHSASIQKDIPTVVQAQPWEGSSNHSPRVTATATAHASPV